MTSSFIVWRYCLHQRQSTELHSAEFVAQGVVSELTPCIPMAMPGPGWRVDVFLYASAVDKGVLFLAWKGSDTRVMYAEEHTRGSTPWHGRWVVSAEHSKVFVDPVQEQWTRVVYLDFAGQEANVQPLYIGLGELTDRFVGIDAKGRAASLYPLSAIGEGFEYTSEEMAKIRMIITRPCAWTVLQRMLPRFSAYGLPRAPRARM